MGILISTMLTNYVDLDVQISLDSCLSELVDITAPNPPFEDELTKKFFQVLVSSFQGLPDHATKPFHKRLHIFESMVRVCSYVMLFDLKFNALVLDIFHHLLASIQDDQCPLLLAHIESVVMGIVNEVDDLLLEFLIFTLLESGCG